MSSLSRNIGGIGAALLVLNGLIGAGIFALPAKMAAQLGSFSPWVFIIFGLFMLSIVWCFGKLVAVYPRTGGPVEYANAGFGRAASFQTGFIYYLARVTAIAANMHVLLLYAGYLWPELNNGVVKSVAIVCITGLLIWVNVTGLKTAMRSLNSVSLLKIVPLIALLVFGFLQLEFSAIQQSTIPPLDAISAGALLTLYAFIGFETVVVTSGETRSPEKSIPRALLLTVMSIALFYFLVQWLYWEVVGDQQVENAPLVTLANIVFGKTGGLVMTATAVISVAGNLLANMISTSRLTYAMAVEKQVPAFLAKVHPTYATPHISILILGIVAGLLALSGSFVWLAVASVLARLVVYAVCILVLMKYQRTHGALLFERCLPVMALVVCAWSIAQSTTESWLFLVGEIALGAILWLTWSRLGNKA